MLESMFHGFVRKIQLFTPDFQWHSLAAIGNQAVVPLVSGLRDSARPNAITRLIISVVVFALQRHSCRAFAHISDKVFKAVPALAHSNTSATVIRVRRMIAVAAACPGSSPLVKLNCIRLAVRSISFDCSFPRQLDVPTSATLGSFFSQPIRAGRHSVSAIALTKPARFAKSVIADSLDNYQPEKSLTSKVVRLHNHLRYGLLRSKCAAASTEILAFGSYPSRVNSSITPKDKRVK